MNLWYGFYFLENRREVVLVWQIAICMLSRDIELLIEGKFLGAGTQSHVLLVYRSACGNQYEQGYFRLETGASLSLRYSEI